jgi:hypothetical protein
VFPAIVTGVLAAIVFGLLLVGIDALLDWALGTDRIEEN